MQAPTDERRALGEETLNEIVTNHLSGEEKNSIKEFYVGRLVSRYIRVKEKTKHVLPTCVRMIGSRIPAILP